MRHFIFLCALFLSSASGASGQQHAQGDKSYWVVVPPESVLLVTASQPECPLKFEEEKILARIGGGGGPSYQLRNRGTKPIKAFTVADLNSTGTGGIWTMTPKAADRWVLPGQLVPQSRDSQAEVVPLKADLSNRLDLQGPMKAIVILMVVRVEFADGTVYDNEKSYKALRAYLESISAKINH